MTLERLMGLPTKQSRVCVYRVCTRMQLQWCLHVEKVTFLLSVINPDMCVKCYGMDRHAAGAAGHFSGAAPRAAPAVPRLSDSARPLTVRRDWRGARRLAVPTQQSQAPLHRTAAAVNKLAVLGNFCPKSICDKSQFLVYQHMKISLNKGKSLSINFKSFYNK